MTIYETYRFIIDHIIERQGKREAENIASIILDDLYGITNVLSSDEFHHVDDLQEIVYRLLDDEPVQYITGMTNFYGYKFKVSPKVLIPRPETEELVHWVLSDFKGRRGLVDVIDIGSGSGCIPIILKKKKTEWRLHAVDKSVDALNVAQINAKYFSTDINFQEMNFLNAKSRKSLGCYNIIISNPPYISTDEFDQMSDNVLKYEPRMALVPIGSPDPLIFYRKLVSFSVKHLFPSGNIYVELNEYLADKIENIFQASGLFELVEVRKDLQGKKRMLKACKM